MRSGSDGSKPGQPVFVCRIIGERMDFQDRSFGKKGTERSANNPIVVDDTPGTYISFLKISHSGLIACASFNTDTIRFLDSWSGALDPFPFFEPIRLHPENASAFYGPQDAVFTYRNSVYGLLVLTTVKSGFQWLPMSD